MKFYYFIASTEGFVEAIARVNATKEEDRVYAYGSGYIQIEDIISTTVGAEDCWLIKFGKVRSDNYPAKTKLGQKGEDLVLDDDEFLSEETSAIFSKDGKKLIVQYNHFGVRASAIRQCLNSLINDQNDRVDLIPVLTADALATYQKKKLTTSVVGCIEGINQADVALANGAGLGEALNKSLEASATTFKFEFAVDARIKSENIDRGFLTKIVDFINQRGGENDKLIVKVKESEEDAVEAIDLLAHRKLTELDDLAIPRTAGRRYEYTHIYMLLAQCFRDWV